MHDTTHAVAHHRVELNGISMHYARCGSGPLVVLLHGFPQGWFIWRDIMGELATDHTVVAPDLRGFGRSEAPRDVADAGSHMMAEDVRQLIDHLGFDTATVVGHDTGGVTAWTLALLHPDRLDSIAVLTTAHPTLFEQEISTNPEQIAASQYLLALRRPETAAALAHDDFAALRAVFHGHPFIEPELIEEHVAAWSAPDAVAGMTGWYRSERLGPAEGSTPARGNWLPEIEPQLVQIPALVMYAEDDRYVLPACFERTAEYAVDAELVRVDGASHWLVQEHPDLVVERLRALLRRALPHESSGSPDERMRARIAAASSSPGTARA